MRPDFKKLEGSFSTVGAVINHLDVTTSTMDVAWKMAREGTPDGTVVVAEHQSDGRGRHDRAWVSEQGRDILCSVVLRPRVALAGDLLMLAALAVIDVAASFGVETGIKWPNDLLDSRSRKVVGILAELDSRQHKVQHVVLGVGINVNQAEFPPELPQAGSLCMTVGELDRAELLGSVVGSIEAWCARVEGDPKGVLDCWRTHWGDRGCEVRVGERLGRAVDVRADGALLLETDAGVEPVLSGDVIPVSRSL